MLLGVTSDAGRARGPDVDGPRVAFRCDGDERIGAGHVARCIPLGGAFGELGWQVTFVGRFRGLASWLLERAGIDTEAPNPSVPCGLCPSPPHATPLQTTGRGLAERAATSRPGEGYDAAVLDSYSIEPGDICALAERLPIATIAEANRCAARGVVLDYHLDAAPRTSARLIAGPAFAPLRKTIAGAGRAAPEIANVLLTMGGSRGADRLAERMAPMVGEAFPEATILLGGGAGSETLEPAGSRFVRLPYPSSLVDVLGRLDAAVTAAGWTAYELACAGVPQVAVAIAANQRRVANGLNMMDAAICLDLSDDDSLADLPAALGRLADPSVRRALARRGVEALDGRGARRAAAALSERWLSRTHT